MHESFEKSKKLGDHLLNEAAKKAQELEAQAKLKRETRETKEEDSETKLKATHDIDDWDELREGK